ncbi:UDP:flavonoid glycosyltransferase YjiC (YdhE family) [Larkinella arboricola]|uniref:UDP:flavonoid glycosyltransferase YjiC (YdhE family) n=1 Tax=Larkinella arboricola TaxID=643671 RepID=A0A327WVZ3_LARAB|nr:nucleotide disphospho-sugar-binding domain-containing protein [Larkinella arboricola]RAJ97462.1 UDP:flavonoid glycosyltransferase YjiC (YdhE family) [Larkinella arboricola]
MNPQRILFATVPFDGHFSPLTGLAVHLKQLGHDVRWYVGGHYGDRVRALGLPHYPTVKARVINQTNMDELFPERKKIKNPISRARFDVKQTFLNPIPGYVDDLMAIHADWPFDLIVYDLACLGALFVQELLAIKGVAVGVLPLFESESNPPADDPHQFPLKRWLVRRAKRAKVYLTFRVMMKPCNVLYNELRGQYGLPPESGFMFESVFRNAHLYLQSGVPGFDYPHRQFSPNVRFVGPLMPHRSGQKTPFRQAERTLPYKHVVLATQGTFENDVEKIIVPTLEAYKNDPDTMVIVTTGGSGTEALRGRYPQSHFLIEDFIDYDAVMPYVNVYVTNGGYGGVMLALKHKLPIVVAGVYEGKDDIADRVQFNQVGINLNTETPKPAQIYRAVTKIRTDDTYRQRARQLSREFEQYQPNQLAVGYINALMTEKPGLLVTT